MGSYMRLGSFLSADELAELPYGKLHRALTTAGRNLDRHHLLFTFSDELLKAGLPSRWPDAQRLAAQLAGSRGFGSSYRLDPGKPAHLTCDYLPGRTLAQVLEKVKEEQAPLGVEHALMVLQGLAQAVILMHEKGFRHGALSPHSAWVSYEGAALILDAPVGTALQAMLPGAPALKAALEPYQCAVPASPFQQDLFGLGAILFEMLTLEPPPGAPGLAAALDQATLRAAQEEAALPGDLLEFLKRLMMVGQPFAGAPEFNGALERVLYDGEVQSHHLQHRVPDAHPVPGRAGGRRHGPAAGPGRGLRAVPAPGGRRPGSGPARQEFQPGRLPAPGGHRRGGGGRLRVHVTTACAGARTRA